MTKDEMKDKISMALKDPILQMGFEVICSKLSRLENENVEMKKQLNLLNLRAIRITELEKENKEILEDNDALNKWVDELKEQIEKMKCCENCRYYSHTYEHCYSYDSYKNCKALSNWRLAE